MRKKSHKEEDENGRYRNLADKATINAFAHKWHAKVLSRSRDIEQPAFADECTALGFEMDCGESFSKAFPDIDFRDVDGFEKVVVGYILAWYCIFTYWRWFTHWNEFHDICGYTPRKWFLSAFDRLIEITNEK